VRLVAVSGLQIKKVSMVQGVHVMMMNIMCRG